MFKIPREKCHALQDFLLSMYIENAAASMGERWGFAEPQQDLIRLFFCAAASLSAVQLSNRDLSIKLRDESRALLAMRAFFPPFAARLKARKLLRDYGYPFSLFIFIRDLYPHKRDQMKCLPAFSTDSFRSSSSVWALFVGAGVFFFFSPQYPKEHMVIKTINAAFLRLFYWL